MEDDFVTSDASCIRRATVADGEQLIRLWGLLFDDSVDGDEAGWKSHAREWFASAVADPASARFPVIEVQGTIVATAIGTLEIGVPNPQCLHGRAVRLANVFTLPKHRGQGYGKSVVADVVLWAKSVGADRVDLSATPDGQRVYQSMGFVMTKAPRMKLVL